jgi:hypothetical protein
MNDGEQKHYLGEELREGSINRFYLIVRDNDDCRLLLEQAGDTRRSCELQPNEFQGHFVNEVPLAEVVARKFAALGVAQRSGVSLP